LTQTRNTPLKWQHGVCQGSTSVSPTLSWTVCCSSALVLGLYVRHCRCCLLCTSPFFRNVSLLFCFLHLCLNWKSQFQVYHIILRIEEKINAEPANTGVTRFMLTKTGSKWQVPRVKWQYLLASMKNHEEQQRNRMTPEEWKTKTESISDTCVESRVLGNIMKTQEESWESKYPRKCKTK